MNTTLDLGNNSPVPSSLPFAQEKEQKKKANKASVRTSTRSLRAYSTLQYAVQATIEFSSTRQEEREIIYSQRKKMRGSCLLNYLFSSLWSHDRLFLALPNSLTAQWQNTRVVTVSVTPSLFALTQFIYLHKTRSHSRDYHQENTSNQTLTFSHQLFLFLKKELKLLLFQKYKVNSNEEGRRKKRGFKAQVIMIIFSDKQTIFLS